MNTVAKDMKTTNEPQVSNSFRIMLEVTNFKSNLINTAKITETEVDLIISVYEVNEKDLPKPLCENFVLENWKLNPEHSDKNQKNSVLFEGISKNDIKQLFLICNVVASGNYEKIKDVGKVKPEEVQVSV